MNQQRLLFEYSPLLILLCIGIAFLYAYLLYQKKQSWNNSTTKILFAIRALLVFMLSFLLLGPILKLTLNRYEKPALAFIIDNSSSIADVIDSMARTTLFDELQATSNRLENAGYTVSITNLDLNEFDDNKLFNHPTSDLNTSYRNLTGLYEGKNLSGIVIVSDGIYNSGNSPLYTPSRIPVYTVGIGDTTERVDAVLRNVLYNKIAYEGNKFPIRAEVILKGIGQGEIEVSVFEKGKRIARDKKSIEGKSLLEFDFQIDAAIKGLHRFDVSVQPISQEQNKKNNYATAYVEVIEGKKKILLVASAPHPDIKVIRSVIEKNANYEFIAHIPGVQEAKPENLLPDNLDLAIFHQTLDYSGRTNSLLNNLLHRNTSLLLILGDRSNIRQLAANDIPITFETPGQFDAITPVLNPDFSDFSFSENTNAIISRYPPVNVPFGKFAYPADANILLYQKIGRVITDRPYLYTTAQESQRMGVMLGDGIWRWRLNEYAETQKTEIFDEFFSKLIQYLSTKEDKRKFRCFPIQSEFTASESVVFESQVYNELYEQTFGNKIELTLTDENGENYSYSYTTSPGNTRYKIGGINEGVYKFRASTNINNSTETVTGEFIITEQNIESQNLTADFGLLKKWSNNTGGKFYLSGQLPLLAQDLTQVESKNLIHSEESFNPLINLKLVFLFLLTLISIEWFTRKYMGGY